MTTLYLDTETWSEADLTKCGGDVYARHPTTECLVLTYCQGDGPVQAWEGGDLPEDFMAAINDPDVALVAHNAMFDRWILEHVLGLPTEITRWRCTLAKAYTMGMPGQLGMLALSLGVSEEQGKIREGKRLIRKFCMPQPKNRKVRRHTKESDPEDWQAFVDYAVRDTDVLRKVDGLIPDWNYRGFELDLYHLDQRSNDRGLPIDLRLAKKAAVMCDRELERLNDELYALTEGEVTAHSKRDEMLAWLARQGVDASGYTKADVSGLLARDLPADARRALEIRQEAGRTSTAKYVKFGQCTAHDGRLRGGFQYGGAARTLRWSGRLVQPQNFARPTIKDTDTLADAILNDSVDVLYDNLMDAAASNMRSVIAAKPGHKLVPGDYANIEGRVLAWLAGEEWKLQAFRDFDAGVGPDLYKVSYSKAFGTPVDQVDSDQRFIGKTAELACGYQGGLGAFQAMAGNFGAEIPDERVLEVVGAWRSAHPRIVSMWHSLEAAATQAIRNPGKPFAAGRVAFKTVGKWLLCRLPSGRFVPYYNPRIVRGGIQYEGLHQKTRQWMHIDTYGGKFCIARDTLVLTENGPVAIQDVQPGVRVWDGDNWVNQDGAVFQGVKPVIEAHGIKATADHLILTTEGWRSASQSKGYNRAHCRIPDGAQLHRLGQRKIPMDRGVSLETGPCAEVFDLANCGPRHRFAVLDREGKPLIVHNCENITQAASRDVMAYNMPLCEEDGYLLVGTVHDEIIPEVPDTDDYTPAGMEAAMGHVPPWCPDLPLAVKAYQTYRYKKD